jgi:hypothetical protein
VVARCVGFVGSMSGLVTAGSCLQGNLFVGIRSHLLQMMQI